MSTLPKVRCSETSYMSEPFVWSNIHGIETIHNIVLYSVPLLVAVSETFLLRDAEISSLGLEESMTKNPRSQQLFSIKYDEALDTLVTPCIDKACASSGCN